MAYELINNSQVTPHRLHALVRLIPRLKDPTRKQVFDLLQPEGLAPNQDAVEEVLRAARECGFIEVEPEGLRVVRLLLSRDAVEATDAFRTAIRRAVLSASDEQQPNYLFNLFTAWYAVQNERVFTFPVNTIDVEFNKELFPDAPNRAVNMTKISGWNTWAAFLGFVFPVRFGNRTIQAPNGAGTLRSLLATILPEPKRQIDFRSFMAQLAEHCPQLDGGTLFERCWQASRPGEVRGTNLSLMLSTGLRQLHDTGAIELVREPDASDNWFLYRAEGHSINQVTHIKSRAN